MKGRGGRKGRRLRRVVGIGGVGACAVSIHACSEPASPPADLVVADVSVLSMASDELLPHRNVVIREGRIVRVMDADEPLPETAALVDGAGLTVLPGLVDMHVHLRSEHALALYVASGVTTVRNMNGAFGDPLRWRSEVARGERVGPSIVTATPTIRGDRGEAYRYRVRTEVDVERLVSEADSLGYDLVKVYQVPAELLAPLVEAAARRGLPVSGHVPFFAEDGAPPEVFRAALDSVLTSGMASIEHLGGLVHAGLRGGASAAAVRDLAEAVAASGVAVTPVMGQDLDLASIVLHGAQAHDPAHLDTLRKYTGEAGLAVIGQQVAGLHGTEPWAIEAQWDLLRALREAGVPILVGTDSHGPNALAGRSTVEEIGHLIGGGFTPFEALEAATTSPARMLGLEGSIGAIVAGARADLLVVRTDPRIDWRTLSDPVAVVLAGRWIPRGELDAMVERAVAAGTYCRSDPCDG